MSEKTNDWYKFLNCEVVIVLDVGSDKPFTYNGLIISIGERLITLRDKMQGEISISKDKVIYIKIKEEKK